MTIGTSTQSRQIRQLPVSHSLHEEQHEHVANILSTASKLSRIHTQHFQSNVRNNEDGHENRSNGYIRFVDEIYSSSILAYDHLRRRREFPKECHHLAYGLIIMDELDIDDASDVEE